MRISASKELLLREVGKLIIGDERLVESLLGDGEYVRRGVRLERYNGRTLLFRKFSHSGGMGIAVIHKGQIRFLDAEGEKAIRSRKYKMQEYFGYYT